MAVYVYGLVAACFLGLGFVLQQDAAARAPTADVLSFRLLLDLVRVPRWLLGIASMVVGQLTSAFALMKGHLSTVEPLLATNLLFAMLFARRLSSQRLGWSGWAGVVLLSGGVTAFIVAGRPEGTEYQASALRHWLVFGGLAGIALVLVLIARHLELFKEPPLLAAAAGALYGLQDALTRVVGDIYSASGVVGVLLSWQGYTIVGLAVVGLVLVQSAFEGGPLRMSLPSLTAAEPLAGIACGIGFLGDSIRLTPGALAGEVIGLLAVVVGVFILGRHPVLPSGKQYDPEAGDAAGAPGSGQREAG
ncbi:DMT family transporter [Streptomyces sp. WMMB303]|uniref:DMT family transporter n=1 Tax=unclassified Streptomyces TaxID=2593676 RepID=UPI0023EB392C|nr:DMT family transporter [Streptomyces sp. WMMB303]MDF4249162.1 DMT family transporter [Streptomyces sp. WMMB303]